MSLLDFFTDPILRAPCLGTILMCIASSLIGVVLFLKKKMLISESLSHATYPGVIAGIAVLGAFFPSFEDFSFVAVLLGALLSSFCALKMINFLQKKMSPDASLCFVLSLFFGLGVVGISLMQRFLPAWTAHVQMLLFGQAATMTDLHIFLYGILALGVSAVFFFAFHPIRATCFDKGFSQTIGIRAEAIEKILFWLLLFSLILGIRSVGLVLMSGMIIAPAIAARQFTDHLGKMFLLSSVFGILSGFLGNVFSVLGTLALTSDGARLSLPTGPMIVVVGGLFAFLSLFFAPKRGWVFRKARVLSFRLKCLEENILKGIWKKGSTSSKDLREDFGISSVSLTLVLGRLARQGWVQKENASYGLTQDGRQKASSIVRLHRLWELYLVDTLKLCSEKVHRTAEEMEHILTPSIERRLTQLLENPMVDPHKQPIPKRPGVL